jgi:enhancer of polycomb-like protein
VEDYESLYPANRWRDPVSYFKTSETTEENTQDALAHGFTYFMDERDKEWLDRNNEEARGEGTSAQGAVSTSGTTTRTSQRSAKAKGKEPDVAQPIVISEDEFELVMGLFEKVTHEKTEFLHHVCSFACLNSAKLTVGRRALNRVLLFHHSPTIKKRSLAC